MKEDVETLPEKEEVIVWVELTQEQRRYYKAIYSQQVILTFRRVGFWLQGNPIKTTRQLCLIVRMYSNCQEALPHLLWCGKGVWIGQ